MKSISKSFKIALVIGSLFLSNSMFARTDLHCPNDCTADNNCTLVNHYNVGYVCTWPELSLSGSKIHPYAAYCDGKSSNIQLSLTCSSKGLVVNNFHGYWAWNSQIQDSVQFSYDFDIDNNAIGHRHMSATVDCLNGNSHQHHVNLSGCASGSDDVVANF